MQVTKEHSKNDIYILLKEVNKTPTFYESYVSTSDYKIKNHKTFRNRWLVSGVSVSFLRSNGSKGAYTRYCIDVCVIWIVYKRHALILQLKKQ